jgi:Domain of unknown function (DUF4412)
MASMMKSLAFAGALCVLTGTAHAADGILIVQKTTIGTDAPQTNRVQIDAKRMRAEATGPTGGKQVVVFDGVKQVMMLIDDAKKTYTEMTRADIDALGAQMSGMMAQLQEQMKNMPPEQRAQMEAMMKGRGMAIPGMAPKTQYRKTGTGTVGKWTCDKYEAYSGETKVSEICTVDPKVLGFTAADFEVSKEMAAFFKKVVPTGAAEMFSVGTAELGFSGVPVRTVTSSGPQPITTEMTEVSRQTFPDSTFEAPAGYQKTDMMMGRGRGRGRQ